MSAMASKKLTFRLFTQPFVQAHTTENVTELCERNSSVIGEFPAQRASNANIVSI